MKKLTVGKYLNKTNKDYRKYGILAKYYGFIGKIFRSIKYLDKSVYYLDKRWNITMEFIYSKPDLVKGL